MGDLQGTVIILMTGLSNLAPGDRSRNRHHRRREGLRKDRVAAEPNLDNLEGVGRFCVIGNMPRAGLEMRSI